VENGVGKPAASERSAPNAGSGKSAWRTPIPHLSRSDRKVGPGLIVLPNGGKFFPIHACRTLMLKMWHENNSPIILRVLRPSGGASTIACPQIAKRYRPTKTA
jgi:hypothetical protein